MIEALIAFVVLSVGIVGALLFHANLLAESANNKSRLEAMSVAEKWIEGHRSQQFASVGSLSVYLNSQAPETVSGKLNDYVVSLSSVSQHPSASNTYRLEYNVSWPANSPTSSLIFASYLGWLDTSQTIKAEDAGVGTPGEYAGSIPIPTGTLSEIPRLEVVSGIDLNAVSTADGSRGSETAKVFLDGDEYKVAVQVGDDWVQLASLKSKDNEIFTITGRIYLNTGDGYRVERGFGPAYGVSSVEDLSFPSSETPVLGTDYYLLTFDHDGDATTEDVTRYYRNNIIDVRASAGANCVISNYENGDVVVTKIKGKDYSVNYGSYGDYICVAGTGWNGTIKPYFRNYDGAQLNDIVIGDFNCAPSVKSFRYYIVQTENLQALEHYKDFNNWGSASVSSILETTSSAIVGQAGLVRFYETESQRVAASSAEGVLWGQYFWHNPNYLINPSATSGQLLAITPDYYGPKTLSLSGETYAGYRAPKVTSGASIARGYDIALPGDVSHQNFYISGSGPSNSLGSCNDVLDYMVGSSPTITSTAIYPEPADTTSDGIFAKHSYFVSMGSPGYEVDGDYRGYIPETGSNIFEASDFNSETITGEPGVSGTLILGYTLATDSVGGTITIPSGASYSADFLIAGNPEPVISITCSVDSESRVVDGTTGAQTYDYSCGVPITWSGEVFAHPVVSSAFTSCDQSHLSPLPSYEVYFGGPFATSSALSSEQESDPAIWYYYNLVASGADSVASNVFDPLQFYDVVVTGNSSSTNSNFCYE